LLALAGGNRRTADVRSKGFSQLFLLSKNDFDETMAEYPDVQKLLKKKAKYVINFNNFIIYVILVSVLISVCTCVIL